MHARFDSGGRPITDPRILELKHNALKRDTPTADLGYWKYRDEARARLVWRVVRHTKINGRKYGLGAFRMSVDALTGELLETDDASWRARLDYRSKPTQPSHRN